MKPELSVVLPVHNQADHIADVIQKYQREFKGRPWEIILVPNKCHDESPRICREIAAKNRNIRVIENKRGGWGLSVRMGLQAARGHFLCYTNSARTLPSTISLLFKQHKKHPGALVKVTRHTRGNWVRSLGSVLYNLECRWLFRMTSWDINGTPKLFTARLFRQLKLTAEGDLLDLEFLKKCARLGIPLFEIPVGGFARYGGKSSMSFKSAIRLYGGALRLWWKTK